MFAVIRYADYYHHPGDQSTNPPFTLPNVGNLSLSSFLIQIECTRNQVNQPNKQPAFPAPLRANLLIISGYTIVVVMMVSLWGSASTRPPAVAGAFYPGDAGELKTQVEGFLESAEPGGPTARAIVVPHAGYVYSGATAAKSFADLDGAALRRVVLLGPSHYARFSGAALPRKGTTAFATPLGDIALDGDAIRDLHLMLQKEVAERIAARPNSKRYGRLTVMLAAWTDIELCFDIGPGAFRPPPKVWSTFLRITPRSSPRFEIEDQAAFERLVAHAFSMRRKTLRRILKGKISESEILAAGFDPTLRPENLEPEDFARLSKLTG